MRCWMAAGILLGPVAPLSAQRPLAIVGGRVVDGNGGAPIERGAVLIRGDRIEAVGPAAAVPIPADAQRIDATGQTLLPGLVDAHVHLTGGWDGVAVDLLGNRASLKAFLYAGVTTVFDVGNVLPYVQQLRQEINAGRLLGPRIRMAGALLDGSNPAWPPISFAVSAPEQIPGIVGQLKRADADFVKAYGGLSADLIRNTVDEAKKQSLRVIVDAWAKNGTLEIAQTGVAAFAHLGRTPVTDETIAEMRTRSTASITTLAVFETGTRRRLGNPAFLDQPLLADAMPPSYLVGLRAFATRPLSGRDSARYRAGEQSLRTAMANAKKLFDAGILLMAGTDSPYPGDYYGEGLHRELELLVEAGLTPLQAITIATRNPARFLGEDARWGTLEVGKRADLIVVRGDPTAHIADSRNVQVVVLGGKVLDRRALRFDPKVDVDFRPAGSAASK